MNGRFAACSSLRAQLVLICSISRLFVPPKLPQEHGESVRHRPALNGTGLLELCTQRFRTGASTPHFGVNFYQRVSKMLWVDLEHLRPLKIRPRAPHGKRKHTPQKTQHRLFLTSLAILTNFIIHFFVIIILLLPSLHSTAKWTV